MRNTPRNKALYPTSSHHILKNLISHGFQWQYPGG